MNQQIVTQEKLQVSAEERNLVALKHGIPGIGTRSTSGHGVEWLVVGHMFAPDYLSFARDGGQVLDDDPRDLLPVIMPQNLSPKSLLLAGQIERCTSRPLVLLDTMPAGRPGMAHPHGHMVSTLYHPGFIPIFCDAANTHETILAHELGHLYIQFVDEREDFRSLKDCSDPSRVAQHFHMQSLVLDQRVHDILREREFDLSIVEGHQRSTVLNYTRLSLLGMKPGSRREAVTIAMHIADAILQQEKGLHEKVVLTDELWYDGTFEKGLRLLRQTNPEIFAIAEGFVDSIRRHGYEDRAGVLCSIDACMRIAFEFTGDPLVDDDLEEHVSCEEYIFDKFPSEFPGWSVRAKVEVGRIMARLNVGPQVPWRTDFSHRGQTQISFYLSTGWTTPVIVPSAPSKPWELVEYEMSGRSKVPGHMPQPVRKVGHSRPNRQGIPTPDHFHGHFSQQLQTQLSHHMPRPMVSQIHNDPFPIPKVPTPLGRQYMPGLGRWMSQARLQERMEELEHAYSYVENNPINLIDPAGLIPTHPVRPSRRPPLRPKSPPSPSSSTCANTPPMLSSAPNPYSPTFYYRDVSAQCMFLNGGDGPWGNIVRGCLVCMYSTGADSDTAHDYCYARAAQRTGIVQATEGLNTAIAAAARCKCEEGTNNLENLYDGLTRAIANLYSHDYR